MSLKNHPDKRRPTGNETIEMLNEKFVEITKAYKALTDEEIRNNFIQYGHPDGKQSFSIGIALPTWIVASGNTYYVLAVYGLLFGILLPYTVGKWWYGTKKRTKDGVMVESAGKLFTEYDEFAGEDKLVEILSVGEEMKEITDGDNEKDRVNGEDATVEKKLAKAGLPEKDMAILNKYEGWRRCALGLLWAYLYRVDLGNEKMENGTSSSPARSPFFSNRPSQTRRCSCCDHSQPFISLHLSGLRKCPTSGRVHPSFPVPDPSYCPRSLAAPPNSVLHQRNHFRHRA